MISGEAWAAQPPHLGSRRLPCTGRQLVAQWDTMLPVFRVQQRRRLLPGWATVMTTTDYAAAFYAVLDGRPGRQLRLVGADGAVLFPTPTNTPDDAG